MEIYFLTHTSTQVSPNIPIEQWPLSEKGKFQALEIAKKLINLGITQIVNSEELKAIETAEIIASKLLLPHHSIKGIQEVRRKIDKILPLEEFMQVCVDYLDGRTPDGWEERYTAQNRLITSLTELINSSDDKEIILVVGHGLSAILVESYIRNIPIQSQGNLESLSHGAGKYLHINVDNNKRMSIISSWQ